MSALETAGLTRRFGGLVALDAVSLTFAPGERCALIGPNGAGKTTFVDLVAGQQRPESGGIRLADVDVTRWPAHRRAASGLARTFQVARLFAGLTPREALALAICERRGSGWNPWSPALAMVRDETERLLDQCGLADIADSDIGILPYGRRRMLDIALALARRPRVLLLDEPAAGVPDEGRRDILGLIARLPAETCVILVEHDMDIVFSFAKRIVVLAAGRVLADGAPRAVAADPLVRAAYLGTAGAAA